MRRPWLLWAETSALLVCILIAYLQGFAAGWRWLSGLF
jgi:hypothetical protein